VTAAFVHIHIKQHTTHSDITAEKPRVAMYTTLEWLSLTCSGVVLETN